MLHKLLQTLTVVSCTRIVHTRSTCNHVFRDVTMVACWCRCKSDSVTELESTSCAICTCNTMIFNTSPIIITDEQRCADLNYNGTTVEVFYWTVSVVCGTTAGWANSKISIRKFRIRPSLSNRISIVPIGIVRFEFESRSGRSKTYRHPGTTGTATLILLVVV